jgi:hypothetical protein
MVVALCASFETGADDNDGASASTTSSLTSLARRGWTHNKTSFRCVVFPPPHGLGIFMVIVLVVLNS